MPPQRKDCYGKISAVEPVLRKVHNRETRTILHAAWPTEVVAPQYLIFSLKGAPRVRLAPYMYVESSSGFRVSTASSRHRLGNTASSTCIVFHRWTCLLWKGRSKCPVTMCEAEWVGCLINRLRTVAASIRGPRLARQVNAD